MGQLRNMLGPERQSKLLLSSLTLPTTHNSFATNDKVSNYFYWAGKFANCQAVQVREQLDMGIRSLDFRVGESLNLRHGKANLKGHLKEVLDVMNDFLDGHTGESIIFQAKWDLWDGTDPSPTKKGTPAAVKQLVQTYSRGYTPEEQPILTDCIGKMVLFNDNGEGAWKPKGNAEITLPTGDSSLNDREKLWDEAQKTFEFLPSQSDIYDGYWWGVSLASQTLDEWSYYVQVLIGKKEVTRPKAFSEYANPRALEWLMDHRSPSRLGRITMDFAEPELCHEIVLRNFDYFM